MLEVDERYVSAYSTYNKKIFTCIYLSPAGDAVLEDENGKVYVIPYENHSAFKKYIP